MGGKPPYADFVNFMEGKTDPEVDNKTTQEIITKKVGDGQLKKDGFDLIITSPGKTATTAEIENQVLQTNKPIRISDYLREPKLPMGSISAEFYEKAKNINEVRQEALEAFLEEPKLTKVCWTFTAGRKGFWFTCGE